MTVRSRMSWIRQQTISHLGVRPVRLARGSRFVSFCFDDFPRSALAIGGAILESYGACGTYYTALGLMGTNNELGEQFHREDLDTLLSHGHELGCHTFQHLSCRSVSGRAFETDVRKGRAELRALTGHDPVNFAYPYGHVTASLKTRIGKQMGSCRSIFPGVNDSAADLNLLRANSLYGDRRQLDAAAALLGSCKGDAAWLVFYTHDVQKQPSPYGCTPGLLEETVIEALRQRFTIATVADVMKIVGQEPADSPTTSRSAVYVAGSWGGGSTHR